MEILDEGFSEKGELTREEKLQARLFQIDLKNSFGDLKYGRIALFVTSGLFLLGVILSLNSEYGFAAKKPLLIEGFVFFIVIFISAFYVPKKPLTAMAIGCGFYFVHLLLSTLGDPMSLVRGILFKAVLIYFLTKGLFGALTYRKAFMGLENLGEEVPVQYRFK